MVHRDPESGQFVADRHDQYDRIEEVATNFRMRGIAADLVGTTNNAWGEEATFDGEFVYDVDEVLGRDELGVMIWAEHYVSHTVTATQTADSTALWQLEIGTHETRAVAESAEAGDYSDVGNPGGDFNAEIKIDNVSTDIDLIGPILTSMAQPSFAEGAGAGGGGTPALLEWVGAPAHDPTFDARDDIQANGVVRIQNVSDATWHGECTLRHVYGVMEEFF